MDDNSSDIFRWASKSTIFHLHVQPTVNTVDYLMHKVGKISFETHFPYGDLIRLLLGTLSDATSQSSHRNYG
jgi:hypothetical protein